ncbi:slightly ste11-like protein [Marasmius crinis-equi]|uniref:Slightly ste11-like protein n=1 Tax=Marasmius crinis-equi TaxID=585013 RepID=A0ABR3FA90_9AGAR
MPALRARDTQARSLEVTNDTPQPPTLAIVSPTPRAFTFPTTHNLSDSPYSTPSSSPFEPDLRSISLSSAAFLHPLAPDSASPASHNRRRKASTSSIASTPPSHADRRPKKGDEDYIKRPENAFILFRRKCCEERDALAASDGNKKQRQADLSKAISQRWKALSEGKRKYWEELARKKNEEYAQLYPNYVYRPQRVRDKSRHARNGKQTKNGTKGLSREEIMSRIWLFHTPLGFHSRSASAPTPPPSFQAVHFLRLNPVSGSGSGPAAGPISANYTTPNTCTNEAGTNRAENDHGPTFSTEYQDQHLVYTASIRAHAFSQCPFGIGQLNPQS